MSTKNWIETANAPQPAEPEPLRFLVWHKDDGLDVVDDFSVYGAYDERDALMQFLKRHPKIVEGPIMVVPYAPKEYQVERETSVEYPSPDERIERTRWVIREGEP